MTHILEDKNRRNLSLVQARVRGVLPEFYQSEYPSLITFLEKYYQYLDSNSATSFDREIKNIISLRDIGQTEEKYLDLIISEIGNGLTVASFFEQPRLMAKLLSSFYKSKGTLLSIEGFFRAFFNSEVIIEYPKDKLFIVGESEIGTESLKFIINNSLYQTFSILIKSGVSVSDYEELYRKFVHPAGFYFAGEIQVEGSSSITLAALGSEDPFDSASTKGIIIAGEAAADISTRFTQITGLYDSAGQTIRIDLNQYVDDYRDISSSRLDSIYENIAELLSPNSFKFDDSDNTIRPDTSLTTETMDNTMFIRYTSDSAI